VEVFDMKYVREKDGKIEILADEDSISASAETIFSTDPSVYEGTWETEKIGVRADISMEPSKIVAVEGGTVKSPAQLKLEGHMRAGKEADRPFWTEPHKAHPKDKVCLNCGKMMKGVRPNRKFCSDKCRKDYSQKGRRAVKKEIKQFVPHRGHEGQVYYMLNGQIKFVPALWCDTEKRAVKYVTERYEGKEQEEVVKQVKGVIGK
jgi:predicted nucleic acid-binding Zn ribbon protein